MALAFVPRGAAQGHAVIERAFIHDDCRLADDDTHAVIDEHASTDGGTRVDFYASRESGQMRTHARQPAQSVAPQPMRPAMHDQRMKTRITGHDFPCRTCSGVALEHAGDVLAESWEKSGSHVF